MIPDNESDFVELTQSLGKFKNLVKNLVKEPVYGVMDALKEREINSSKDVFSYTEALEYAIDMKLKYSSVKSTLLKLERSPKGLLITQVFVDDKEEMMTKKRGYLGRRILVKKLDDELNELFSNDDSIFIDLPER